MRAQRLAFTAVKEVQSTSLRNHTLGIEPSKARWEARHHAVGEKCPTIPFLVFKGWRGMVSFKLAGRTSGTAYSKFFWSVCSAASRLEFSNTNQILIKSAAAPSRLLFSGLVGKKTISTHAHPKKCEPGFLLAQKFFSQIKRR